MEKKFRMIVRYGQFDEPKYYLAKKIEQMAQGWFRVMTLEEDVYIHTSKLLSIILDGVENETDTL